MTWTHKIQHTEIHPTARPHPPRSCSSSQRDAESGLVSPPSQLAGAVYGGFRGCRASAGLGVGEGRFGHVRNVGHLKLYLPLKTKGKDDEEKYDY